MCVAMCVQVPPTARRVLVTWVVVSLVMWMLGTKLPPSCGRADFQLAV